ncbi:MAG TPA: hypothetical protein VIW01_02610 [Dehalococcoidia bacterium]
MKRDVFRRTGLINAAAVFVLVGAILPNVAYLGHMQPALSHSHAAHQANTPQDSAGEEHELHCHAGPASCAGAQSMVATVWVGEDAGLIAPASETRTALDASQPTIPEAPVFPILEPPRAA